MWGAPETYSVINVPGVIYAWTLPATWTGSSVINSIDATIGSAGGTIEVTPSNTCGNGLPISLSISSLQTTPTAGFTYVDNEGTVTFTNTSNGGDSYSWDFGDSNTSTDENPIHTYAATNLYDVILTVTNSCGSDVYNMNINVALSIYSINNYNINIYPNPVKDILNIELENNSKAMYQIFDITGKIIVEDEIRKGENQKSIQLSNLSSGIYNLRLTIDNNIINHKLIIE